MRRALVVLAMTGCQLLVGVHDRTLDEDASIGDERSEVPCNGADFTSDAKNCGFCGHACEHCTNGLCPTTDIVNARGLRAFAVDDTSIYVSADDGIHVYAKKDGTPLRAWPAAPAPDVEALAGNAYWIEKPSDIFVGYPDGGSARLVTDDASVAVDLAVDPSHLFWVTNHEGMRRAERDGTGLAILLKEAQAMSGKAQVKTSNGWVYGWSTKNNLYRFPPNVEAGATPETIISLPLDSFAIAEPRLYHAHNLLNSDAETVDSYDLDSGTPNHIVNTETLTRIAVSNGRIYADLVSGKIIVFGEDMPAVVLASGQPQSWGIAVDDTWVYWMTGVAEGGTMPGTIRRVRK